MLFGTARLMLSPLSARVYPFFVASFTLISPSLLSIDLTDIATPCLSCAVNVNAGSPFSLNLRPFCLFVALSGVNTGSATAVPVALLLDTPLSSLAVIQFAVSILRGLLQDLSMPKDCTTYGLFSPPAVCC